ncbi:MAG: AtpZ/AtpI family protein [Patescibacteria group bacterium]
MGNKVIKNNNFRAYALATSLYGGVSIFGPLLVLAGGGYFLDKYFQTGRLFLFIGIGLAFIVTNVLLYRRAFSIMKEMEKDLPPKPEEEDDFKDF